MATGPRIESTMGETRSGLPWATKTYVNGIVGVDGWGVISHRIAAPRGMTPDEARHRADKLEEAAVALRVAAAWAETYADELRGYDR